jgi:hypothetical protein
MVSLTASQRLRAILRLSDQGTLHNAATGSRNAVLWMQVTPSGAWA